MRLKVLRIRKTFENRIKKRNLYKLVKDHVSRAHAPNVGSLKREDYVVFYLVGQEGHCFLGTCVLNSGFEELDDERSKKITHPEYLDWKQGVSLKEVDEWVKSLPIERLRGKVSFVPSEGN